MTETTATATAPSRTAEAPLRVGTRASLLARTQSEQVAALLREALGREVVLVEVTTEGDISAAPLASMGGAGVFVSAPAKVPATTGTGRPSAWPRSPATAAMAPKVPVTDRIGPHPVRSTAKKVGPETTPTV